MGKLKKVQQTEKNEGQKKISSFFQKPSSVTKSSGLFTQLGQKSGQGKRQPADSAYKEVIEIGDDNDFKPPKLNKDRKEFAQSRLEKALKQSENVRNAAWSDGAASCHPEVTVVPETQLPFTPEGKGFDASKENVVKSNPGTFQSPGSVSSDVSDLGIIPDTPDNVQEKPKAKQPLGRSFLLSASHFASNPIQEAKENKEAKLALKRKRASLARKSLVSVSVNFNSESHPEKKSENVMHRTEGQDTKTPCPEYDGDITDEVKDVHNDMNGREATPTKIYSNGASLKRMAKLGDSPDSKRTTGSGMLISDTNTDKNGAVKNLGFDQNAIDDGKQTEEEIDNTLEIEEMNKKAAALIEEQEKKVREKRDKQERERQQRMERKKQMIKEEKKKNSEKMLKYQLSGNAASFSSNKTKTLSNDDTLDDILQELHSPSLLKSSKVSDSKKNSSSVSASVKEVKKNNSDSVNKCKRYSLEGVLVEGSREKDATVNISGLKESDTSVKPNQKQKSGRTAGKDANEISMEWTEDDEKYFAELGVKTDKSTSRDTSGITLNVNDISKPTAGSGKHKLVISKPVRKETTSGGQQSKNRIVKYKSEEIVADKSNSNENVEITDFPTQGCQATEISKIQHQEVDIDDFGTQTESMFGDFDDETESQQICQQLENMSPFKRKIQSNSVFQRHAPCTEFSRHIVTEVHHDRTKQETILEITSQPSEKARKCILHGFWLDTVVEKGDIVNVLAEFTDGLCNITDKHGLLIVNPDLLISGTTVVSSMFCMRKSILKEKFKGCDSRNIHMLYGSIIHSVFQQVLKKKLVTEKSVLQEAETTINQSGNLLEMYANKITEDKVLEEIKSYIPQIMSWIKQYTNIGQDIIGNQRSGSSDVIITKVKDIEENIWSPRFGVKGKIDLTVEVKIKNEKKKSLLPLELKTGKVSYSDEHKGQVTLYSMMSADRREDPNKGLLLYLKEPSMRTIPADHVHKKGLTQLRNEMAHYISRQVVKTEDETGTVTYTLGRLPQPISNVRACQKCPQLINCSIHQREIEGRTPSGLVTDALQHLTSSHMNYFVQWCLMLDLEAKVNQSKRTLADIWCLSSGEREDAGMCLGGMALTKDWKTDLVGDDLVILSFTRHSDNNRKTGLSSVGINPQDSVVVSCEKPSWIALCTGFVHSISSTRIQVLTDSDVIDRMQTLQKNVFRVDKSDNFSTAGMLYTNLSRLMTPEASYERLRQLIIDTVKPEFSATLSKGNLEKVKSIFKVLNKPQKTAVLKVLMCKDYVLIKGYPGTGKTSTIVALVKVLHSLGLSVLLTSYTHSAVDNILLKLKKDKVSFLRLGRLAKIHPEIQEYSADRQTRHITNTSDLETFLHSQMIVATSCLGTTHPLFSRRQFDVCIVDEASQVLQPACLGPLFSCKRFVLVGDPKQLPPVVQSKEAKKLGMDESLFAKLDGRGATFDLNLQYRMNKEIVIISNMLVYKGCLQCGSETVANRTLHIPAPDSVQTMVDCDPWLSSVLDSSLDKSIVFLDTQQVPAPEIKDKGGVVKNYTEAKIVMHIVSTLTKAGVLPEDIGIIAPYRSQVFLLRNLMDEGQGQSSGVEVNTVDQYQGRDKNVIIISFVRSSKDGDTKTGELLKDVRRLNVAVTRAKTKLVLIGDTVTLKQYQPLQQVIDLCNTKQQITSLPEGAAS